MQAPKIPNRSTLKDLINYRLRVLSVDGRVYVGTLLAFDAHMNLVLADCIEERLAESQLKSLQKEPTGKPRPEKRTLGLAILRGEHVLSTLVESPPTLSKKERIQSENKVKKKLSSKKQRSSTATATRLGAHHSTANTSTGIIGSTGVTNQRQRAARFQAPPGFKKR